MRLFVHRRHEYLNSKCTSPLARTARYFLRISNLIVKVSRTKLQLHLSTSFIGVLHCCTSQQSWRQHESLTCITDVSLYIQHPPWWRGCEELRQLAEWGESHEFLLCQIVVSFNEDLLSFLCEFLCYELRVILFDFTDPVGNDIKTHIQLSHVINVQFIFLTLRESTGSHDWFKKSSMKHKRSLVWNSMYSLTGYDSWGFRCWTRPNLILFCKICSIKRTSVHEQHGETILR